MIPSSYTALLLVIVWEGALRDHAMQLALTIYYQPCGYSPTPPAVDDIAVLVLDTQGVEAGGTASDVETWGPWFVDGRVVINCSIHSRCVWVKSISGADEDDGVGNWSSDIAYKDTGKLERFRKLAFASALAPMRLTLRT